MCTSLILERQSLKVINEEMGGGLVGLWAVSIAPVSLFSIRILALDNTRISNCQGSSALFTYRITPDKSIRQ